MWEEEKWSGIHCSRMCENPLYSQRYAYHCQWTVNFVILISTCESANFLGWKMPTTTKPCACETMMRLLTRWTILTKQPSSSVTSGNLPVPRADVLQSWILQVDTSQSRNWNEKQICVCVCVHTCVRTCVRACVRACVLHVVERWCGWDGQLCKQDM